MSIRRGLYRIRSLPRQDSDFLGGLYATHENREVVLAPDTPDFVNQQTWEIDPLDGGEKGAVFVRAIPGGPEGASWHNLGFEENSPIILAQPKIFIFELVKPVTPDGKVGLYTIRPADPPERIGATVYVGSDQSKRVALNWVPVIPDPDRPVWELISESEE